jgi:phage terminase large subunit-like protein
VTAPDDLLAAEIRTLISQLREMNHRHRARLDAHRVDGEVIEGEYAAYEDARWETTTEASDRLDRLVDELEQLITPGGAGPFTVAVAGLERRDGANPTLFTVTGTGLEAAYALLTRLPTYRAWLADALAGGSSDHGPTVVVIPEASHPGLPTPGTFIDLRQEQARIPTASPTTTAPGTLPTLPLQPPARRLPTF